MPSILVNIEISGAEHLARLEEVVPGICVEYPTAYAENTFERYRDFIAEVLKEVSRVEIGAQLLDEFDPGKSPSEHQTVHYDHSGKKLATARLLIQPPTVLMKKKGQPFFTDTDRAQVSADSARKKYAENFWVPLIFFYQPLDSAERPFEGNLRVSGKGVLAHNDKPDDEKDPWPFSVVLFHELCHAYLSFKGITHLLDHIDEQLVTGLHDGAGYMYSENHFRIQAGMPLRQSYKSRGVPKWAPDAQKWKRPTTLTEALAKFQIDYETERRAHDTRDTG